MATQAGDIEFFLMIEIHIILILIQFKLANNTDKIENKDRNSQQSSDNPIAINNEAR